MAPVLEKPMKPVLYREWLFEIQLSDVKERLLMLRISFKVWSDINRQEDVERLNHQSSVGFMYPTLNQFVLAKDWTVT